MNVVRKKLDKSILRAGFCDFTGQFDTDVYEQIEVQAEDANFKYKKFDAEDNYIDMTEEERQAIDAAEIKEALKLEIIDLQKQVNACADLLTYTAMNSEDIIAKQNELIMLRDTKIEEYNLLGEGYGY